MNRDSVLIEADELLTKLGANNLRIYDATILFFRTETDPPTAYQQYLQGHIPGGPSSTTKGSQIDTASMNTCSYLRPNL